MHSTRINPKRAKPRRTKQPDFSAGAPAQAQYGTPIRPRAALKAKRDKPRRRLDGASRGEADGKAHMRRVERLGCCVRNSDCSAAATVTAHHLTGLAYRGGSQKASDFETIPLCLNHHTAGGPGIAFHAGEETWEAEYGTQEWHLEQTRAKLRIAFRDWCPLTGKRVRG
jgi:hypothetical protein